MMEYRRRRGSLESMAYKKLVHMILSVQCLMDVVP